MKKIKWNLKYIIILLVAASIVFLYWRFPIFKELMGVVLISFIITYTLKPLQKLLMERGLNRKLSSIILVLGILTIMGAFIAIFIPWIYNESSNFAQAIAEFKEYFDIAMEKVNHLSNIDFMKEVFHNSYGKIKDVMIGLTSNFISEILAVAENIFLLFIIPTLVYFFLSDGENISGSLMKYMPVNNKYAIKKMSNHIDKVMERYIITQFQLCGIIGVFTYLVLIITKVKYPFLLSFLNGIFNIIPYFGPVIGAVPIILVALITSTKKAVVVTIWLIVIQQVEGDIICPKILGETVNSHPVTILLLLIIGGSLAGIIGMILVIPVWTMIKIVMVEIEDYLF